MSIVVFVESAEGKIKRTSLEAVAYGKALGESVTAVAVGPAPVEELEGLGAFGASKVLHVNDSRLEEENIQAYATVLASAVQAESAKIVVLAASSLGTPVAAIVATRLRASLATNVTELPDTSSSFVVKRSIYTGKAFSRVELTAALKVIAIRKNAIEITEGSGKAAVTRFEATLSEKDFATKTIRSERTTGEVLLPEAEIVVSGGRGMKGPEHWGIIEELAKTLGAATGCSKPVSDMGWRPHHEHVGQTGVKVSPQLYIAVGISGAIQHLAGVNSSKHIVVINKDPEAPFFKAANYGIVGDAFDVVPKLTEAIKAGRK